MHLTTAVTRAGRWYVVSVQGELDMASAPRLRQKVASMPMDRPLVVLDLRGVPFIDSTGLGVVVGLLKRLRTSDGELRVVCDTPRVRRVFEITDLTRVFRLYEGLDEAVEDPYE